ncbi:hypothetical protein CDIK_3358 [Cucumispora dikerogammari]|nr:hypothetical protein CDIK_3358 [Cucumispora dikerogammari]
MDINYRTRCIIYRVQQMSNATLPFNLTSISDSTTEETRKIFKNSVYILDQTQVIINTIQHTLITTDRLSFKDIAKIDADITNTEHVSDKIQDRITATNIIIKETNNKIDLYINDNIKLYIKEQIEIYNQNQILTKKCQNIIHCQNIQEISKTTSIRSTDTVDESIQEINKQLTVQI